MIRIQNQVDFIYHLSFIIYHLSFLENSPVFAQEATATLRPTFGPTCGPTPGLTCSPTPALPVTAGSASFVPLLLGFGLFFLLIGFGVWALVLERIRE